jgi:hypothetical protein
LYGQQKQNYEDMILLVDEIIDDFSKYMPEGVIIWITEKKWLHMAMWLQWKLKSWEALK